MSHDTQGTPAPAFRPGEATFFAPFGHTLKLEVGPDYIFTAILVDGADSRQPLASIYSYRKARSAHVNRVPVLVVGHAYLPLPYPSWAAASAFLAAHGAYLRTEGVDA